MWKRDLVNEILAKAQTENLFTTVYNKDTGRELSIEDIEVVNGQIHIIVADE